MEFEILEKQKTTLTLKDFIIELPNLMVIINIFWGIDELS